MIGSRKSRAQLAREREAADAALRMDSVIDAARHLKHLASQSRLTIRVMSADGSEKAIHAVMILADLGADRLVLRGYDYRQDPVPQAAVVVEEDFPPEGARRVG